MFHKIPAACTLQPLPSGILFYFMTSVSRVSQQKVNGFFSCSACDWQVAAPNKTTSTRSLVEKTSGFTKTTGSSTSLAFEASLIDKLLMH